jgi:NAD(P)-dependent dehydrogenase (short-subunit alcohol dehydrogenase family)
MRFKDKTVVILGGNSGIGLSSAKAFASEGANVVITGRNPKTLNDAQREIGNDRCSSFQSDISDLNALEELFEKISEQFQTIDVLFVNAGIGNFKPLADIDESYWEHMIGVNLKGPFFAVQKAVPMMRSGSSIIMTSSIGHVKGFPGNSVYAASKAGLRALVRNLGAELVEQGIRVNCLSPGAIETPLFDRSGLDEAEKKVMKESFLNTIPMKRMGTSEEVANSVLFLASDESSYINGIDLFVDGGVVSF